MKLDNLRQRFEEPASYRWVPLSALKAGEYLSCVDGRHSDHVVSAPGGDVGEAVLLFAALEDHRGEAFADEQLHRAMRALMNWHPRFYMHTDEHAVMRLEEHLEEGPYAHLLDRILPLDRMDSILQRPPHDLRQPLLGYLTDPEYVGCGHLALVLRDPAAYGVRPGLCRTVMQSFLRHMWDGVPSAQFEMLRGVHQEQAIVTIEVAGEPTDGLFVPSVSGGDRGHKIFVEHVPAREYLRRSYLEVLEGRGIIEDAPDDEVLGAASRLGEAQCNATFEALAPELPRFTVRFGESHLPTISPGI